jgi:hypothetical protein
LIHLIASRLQHRYAPAPPPAAGKYVGVEAGADLAFIASIWLAAAGTMALGIKAILAGGRPVLAGTAQSRNSASGSASAKFAK